MKIIQDPAAMQRSALEWRRAGKRIGFVPTMGFLHEGHLSLMRLARAQCDVLVVSIFVNPTQFDQAADLIAYPCDFARDESLCEAEQVDVIFYPSAESMYAADASTWVDEELLSKGLCGASRAGHFRGVCTVVAKLFNLVQPDLAVFGEKDAQQLRVIERMVRDLYFPIQIIRGSIVRESDGLAMSSRNKNLSPQQRKDALCLSRALRRAEELFEAGEHSIPVLQQAMATIINEANGATVDYITFVDDESLEPVHPQTRRILVALAVKFGAVRLIDNQILTL